MMPVESCSFNTLGNVAVVILQCVANVLAVSVFSQAQELCLQGKTYDKLALWRDAGSASPVTTRPFNDMGTNVTEDERCLKPASRKACLTEAEWDGKAADSCVGKTWQKVFVVQAPDEELLLNLEKPAGMCCQPVGTVLNHDPAAAVGEGKSTALAEASEAELHELLPDGVTPAINLLQLLVPNCAGNYCKIDRAISNRKTALQNSKHLLPRVMHSLSTEINRNNVNGGAWIPAGSLQ